MTYFHHFFKNDLKWRSDGEPEEVWLGISLRYTQLHAVYTPFVYAIVGCEITSDHVDIDIVNHRYRGAPFAVSMIDSPAVFAISRRSHGVTDTKKKESLGYFRITEFNLGIASCACSCGKFCRTEQTEEVSMGVSCP